MPLKDYTQNNSIFQLSLLKRNKDSAVNMSIDCLEVILEAIVLYQFQPTPLMLSGPKSKFQITFF